MPYWQNLSGFYCFLRRISCIDVNKIAEASQVSEDQVEEALDQLFGVDPEAEKSEEITVPEMKERIEEVAEEPVNDDSAPVEEKEEAEESIEPTLITDGDEVEKIKADLQAALDNVKALTEGREKDGIEIANSDAEVARLTSENEDLKSELDERVLESEELVEQFEALKAMSVKLLEAYKAAKEVFDSKKEEKPVEEVKESPAEEQLREELDLERSKREAAEESCEKLKSSNSTLRKELMSAKESLISYHSTALGVPEKALRNSLGKNYSVKSIKAAAESLANQSTYSVPVLPVVKRRAASTESLMVGNDDIERELIAQINSNK